MRCRRFAGILICGVLLSAAFSQKQHPFQRIKSNCPKAGTPTPHLPTDTRNLEITLTRTPCWGFCPTYSIKIRGDGGVLYESNGFVKVRGERRSRISAAQVRKLAERFISEGYFSFCGTYGQPSDLPGAITSIKWPGVRKTVTNHGGFVGAIPKELFDLEEAIDNIVDSQQWVGTGVIPHVEVEDVPPPILRFPPQPLPEVLTSTPSPH